MDGSFTKVSGRLPASGNPFLSLLSCKGRKVGITGYFRFESPLLSVANA